MSLFAHPVTGLAHGREEAVVFEEKGNESHVKAAIGIEGAIEIEGHSANGSLCHATVILRLRHVVESGSSQPQGISGGSTQVDARYLSITTRSIAVIPTERAASRTRASSP